MEKKNRFSTNGYYIYDHFTDEKWLVNIVEAQEIVEVMNNLDTKARENSKGLSTLQKKLDNVEEELKQYKRDWMGFIMRYNYCGNPLRCKKENRKFETINWRKTSNISYYSDDKLDSILYTPNCYYSICW